jgi:hypothetical protein
LASTATAFASNPIVRWRGASVREAILEAIDPHVRANFLAAKAWREQERVAAFTRLPSFRRLTAQDEYGSLKDYEPSPHGVIGWASARNAYELPLAPRLNLFEAFDGTDQSDKGVFGALARYPKD